MTEPRPATVRFYFDADVLGIAKVVAALRYDVTYPGDPGATINKRIRLACPVTTPAVKDDVWIPEVAQRGWLIITRDHHIQDHPAETAAVRDHGAKDGRAQRRRRRKRLEPVGSHDGELAKV